MVVVQHNGHVQDFKKLRRQITNMLSDTLFNLISGNLPYSVQHAPLHTATPLLHTALLSRFSLDVPFD